LCGRVFYFCVGPGINFEPSLRHAYEGENSEIKVLHFRHIGKLKFQVSYRFVPYSQWNSITLVSIPYKMVVIGGDLEKFLGDLHQLKIFSHTQINSPYNHLIGPPNEINLLGKVAMPAMPTAWGPPAWPFVCSPGCPAIHWGGWHGRAKLKLYVLPDSSLISYLITMGIVAIESANRTGSSTSCFIIFRYVLVALEPPERAFPYYNLIWVKISR
jgi:hypothetical protein